VSGESKRVKSEALLVSGEWRVESGTDFSICLAAGELGKGKRGKGKAEKGMGGDWRREQGKG